MRGKVVYYSHRIREEGSPMPILYELFPAANAAAGAWLSSTILWIVMLVIGFALVVVEIYLPGFGAPGILGTLLLIGGIVLCAKGNIVLALILMGVIIALLCVVLSVSIHSASKGRLQKSKLVLHEAETPQVSDQDLSYYVGKTGVACTVLRPAGIGEFEGLKLNVLSYGDFIGEGERITVIRVEGNQIVVDRAA